MAGSVANTKIEPCRVYWGVDTAQVQKVLVLPDVSLSLQNKYFLIYTALNAIKYYVWFNVNSAGADPAIPGATGVAVAIATNASAAAVATAAASAIDALAGFIATASGNAITITNASVGYSSAVHDSKAASQTGFGFSVSVQGILKQEVGLIDGDSTLKAFEDDTLDIKAQESGSDLLGQLIKGKKASSVELNFMETSPAQLRKVLVQSGMSFFPDAAGSTEVVGIGSGNKFGNTFSRSSQLLFHPVRLADTDHSEDFLFWLAYPVLKDLKFSGEKVEVLPLTFTLFLDQSRKKGLELGVYGDATQTLT